MIDHVALYRFSPLGTMRLVRANLAEFRQNKKLVARFKPAPLHWPTVICD